MVEELEQRAVDAAESGDHTTALHLFREALAAYRSSGLTDVWREQRLLKCIGYAGQVCSELDIARKHYEEALRLIRHAREPDYETLADALHRLGDTHLQRDEPKIAEIYLRESLDWSRRINDYATVAHIAYDLAKLVEHHRDKEEARQCFYECLEACRSHGGEWWYQVNALRALSRLAVEQKATDSARGFFADALRIAEEEQITPHEIGIWNGLGSGAQLLEDDDIAVRCWETALQFARERDKAEAAADVLYNLGRHEAWRKNPDAALRHLREALRIRRSLNDVKGTADTLSALGHLARDGRKYDQAFEHFKEGLRHHHGLHRREVVIRQLYHMAVLFGAAKRYPEVCRLLGTVERLLEETPARETLNTDEKRYIADVRKWAFAGNRRRSFAKNWDAGRALSYDAAIERALTEQWQKKSRFRRLSLFGRRAGQENPAAVMVDLTTKGGSEESGRNR